WPDGTLTPRYGFRHTLYQQVVYERILLGRRVRLHRLIGGRLEVGYGARASERAVELAMHFEYGRDASRAVVYLQQAVTQALGRRAYADAIARGPRALALLESLPDPPARAQQELDVQLALGPAWMETKGYASKEAEQAYIRARTLCQQVGETPQLFPVLMGLC